MDSHTPSAIVKSMIRELADDFVDSLNEVKGRSLDGHLFACSCVFPATLMTRVLAPS